MLWWGDITTQKEGELSLQESKKVTLETASDAIAESLQYVNPDDKEINESKIIFIYAQQIIDCYEKNLSDRELYHDLCQNNNKLESTIFIQKLQQLSTQMQILRNSIKLHDLIGGGEESEQLAELEYYNIEQIKTATYSIEQQICHINSYIEEYLK